MGSTRRSGVAVLGAALAWSPSLQAAAPPSAPLPAPPAPASTVPAPPASAPDSAPTPAPPAPAPAPDSAPSPAAPASVPPPPPPPPPSAPSAAPAAAPEAAAPVTLAPKQRPSIHATPPPATGFRGIFNVGLSFPVGSASGAPGDKLGDRYSLQLPFIAEVGRVIEHSFYAGLYAGLSLGGQGQSKRVAGECSVDDGVKCRASSGMIGLAVAYAPNPAAHLSPWFGYGIGFELSQLEVEDPSDGRDERVTSTGVTYARLSGGLDVREKVGFGPFVQVALGQFTSTQTKLKGTGDFERRIEDCALHAWITLGARVVLNP